MEPNNEEQIAQRLAQLPADVRNAVLSVEWEQKLQAIGEKHHLHIDQVGALGDVTLMTMLGMVGLDQYPVRIAQELKIAQPDADAIAKEANDGVFMPIRESMKSFTGTRGGAEPVTPEKSLGGGVPPTAQAGGGVKDFSKESPAQPITSPAPVPVAPKPDLSKADAMLAATVVSAPAMPKTTPTIPAAPAAPATPTAPAAAKTPEPPKPTAYATDPYREPPV